MTAISTRLSAIDELLTQARLGWRRMSATEAVAAQREGALLVDVRTDPQRAEVGDLPGAVVIDLTVLEWRLDPTSEMAIPEAAADRVIVLVCRQGYSSSLAAARLHAVGLPLATDIIGGVEAWQDAGLPLHRGPADVRR